MTIADDTEWLRKRLVQEGFHADYSQCWIAVRDAKVVRSERSRDELEAWLQGHDPEGRCVLAFTDSRPFA